MWKRLSALLGVAMSFAAPFGVRGDCTMEYSVQVTAEVQASPAQITLNWLPDTTTTPTGYTIYRRETGSQSWNNPVSVPGTTTNFIDRNVRVGVPYEYQIVKQTPARTGYGYIYSGIEVPANEYRGKLLLVVDNTHATDLARELTRLQQDLAGDGWTPVRIDVNRNDPVTRVKALIKQQYDADPKHVKAVFLFGHVPVPYSGDIAPDGHYREHEGAWPCDGYYADMKGVWTDKEVSDARATDSRNHNVPGDGKFDQSCFPTPLTLMIGRVDLANMPGRHTAGGAATFPSELELLRNYLNKDHNFRRKLLTVPDRAVVGDYFGARDGEAFAASAWRNFAPFVGAGNIAIVDTEGTWISNLSSNACLWAYGCGSGSYTSIGGIGSVGEYKDGVTTELVDNDLKAVFTMLYGSWLGDWDSEDNIQRAVLATADYGLTCSWSGRPHWFMHHMALGEPIGFSTLLTQNNGFSKLYRNHKNNCVGWTHIALMGDPTLRMHVVAPPSNLAAVRNGAKVVLTWTAANDAAAGYNIYRAPDISGPFTRLNAKPVAQTTFTDTTSGTAADVYLVRTMKLETSASGSYFNLSCGEFVSPATAPANLVLATEEAPAAPAHKTGTAPAKAKPADAPAKENAATEVKLSPTGTTGAQDTIWFGDALPAGAAPDFMGGDSWNWVSANPAPASGTVSHQSGIDAGLHQHWFSSATAGLTVNTGEALFVDVYLDPANVPSELMFQWGDGSWEHRAYWGANVIPWGTDGTAGRKYMGALPAAGQWVRLQIPAADVGLENKTVTGMAFTLYGGRASFDDTGKTFVVGTSEPPVVSTNPPPTTSNSPPAASPTTATFTNELFPGTTTVDNIALRMPRPGDYALHVLTPTLLELKLINSKDPDPARVTQWDWVNNYQFTTPPLNAFAVTANGQSIGVTTVGFKRRPFYAPLVGYDLRIDNSLYLRLSSPVSDNQQVEVKNPDGSLWAGNIQFAAKVDPLRYSPAIHVNQEGYMPNYSKKAMAGYYIGNLGEMDFNPASGFRIVDANGATVHQGTLIQRADVGYIYTPTPYQKVYEADFTSFNTPGEYRLVIPGLGASLPFRISEGIAMNFARTYALGLYHQRCGMDNTLPHTRFTHADCHKAAAAVPSSSSDFPFTWSKIAEYAQITNPDNPVQTAPRLTSPSAQRFPFVRQGTVDVSGGHHDAGDYSKYTLNSAALIHYLTFAVDSMAGVKDLDNLGIPESGDGISDLLQEAKWEADFLAKLQDNDGGFYFLVYPRNREYEGDVLPENGDPQLVWPKTSSATACSVAALAEIGSSPAFKAAYPQTAALYMQKAQLGWQFLMNGINRYGKDGIYQKITHYGDDFGDRDELAWAAAAMFAATGDAQYHNTLMQWFPDPTDPATFRWGWWRLFLSYGNAVRDYAFAVRSGRLQASQVNAAYLAKCESVIVACGDDLVTWSKQNAYGTSFPEPTKRVQGAGWYFSGEQIFDIGVAYQINPKADFMTAILANMNYEGGCNPVNVSFVTGMGWKRERDAVSQYAANDRRIMPPTGQPIGNIQWGFSYLDNYKGSLNALCFPSDNAPTAPFPFYDRWADSWNVSTEFVTFIQSRALATYAFVAAQTSLKTQPWRAVQGTINVPSGAITGPVTFSLQAPGVDLSTARITWETRDGEPAMGQTFTFSPKINGAQWVEAEAQLPDGRRVFATANFTANTPNVVWVDDNVPAGAAANADGGDTWNWVVSSPTPFSGSKAHQSNLAPGAHQHFFLNATATMQVATGATLYCYIYLDPANPPAEVMLQWFDGTSWDHRAYWGANNIPWGADNTAARRYIGPLPAAGQWVQLQVPASQVGLEGKTVSGMGFTLFDGRATWDAAGAVNPTTSGGATNNPGSNTVISVTASNASRVGPSQGTFTFSRSGSTTNALNVGYILEGTAKGGVDYQVPQGASPAAQASTFVATIPAGSSSVTVPIAPMPATQPCSDQTVVMNVMSNSSYTLGAPANATVVIAGNTLRPTHMKMAGPGMNLGWHGAPGAIYRVAYKNQLTDPAWTLSTNPITRNDSICYFTDYGCRTQSLQRFYLIMQVQ